MNKKGFTLLELLVAILVLGLLGALMFTGYQRILQEGNDRTRVIEIGDLHTDLETYYYQHSKSYPAKLSDLPIAKNDPEVLVDSGGQDYKYKATASGGGQCSTEAMNCTRYELSTNLESTGEIFSRDSLN